MNGIIGGKRMEMRVEYCTSYWSVDKDGNRNLRQIGLDRRTLLEAEEEMRDIQRDDPDTHFFITKRYFSEYVPLEDDSF